ncbi:MAG TPA: hypothetical protein VNM66_00755, partial [Thermodesulfobacteriota bacterium]|nr:hypothetical protein [Thermodesulfobacteriota bacterium]
MVRGGGAASADTRSPWLVRALIGLVVVSVVGGALDVRLDGGWEGTRAELARHVLEEPDRDVRAAVLAHRSRYTAALARAVRPLGGREVAVALVLGLALAGRVLRRPALS